MAVITDDLAPSPGRRFSLATAIRRNPTIAFGGILLALLIAARSSVWIALRTSAIAASAT